MKAEVLSITDSTLLPEISLVLFVLVFCISLYRAYRPSKKKYYQNVASIVLNDAPRAVASTSPSPEESCHVPTH